MIDTAKYGIRVPARLWVDYNMAETATNGTGCFVAYPEGDVDPGLHVGDWFIADNHGDGAVDQVAKVYEVRRYRSALDGRPLVRYLFHEMHDWITIKGNTITGADQ